MNFCALMPVSRRPPLLLAALLMLTLAGGGLTAASAQAEPAQKSSKTSKSKKTSTGSSSRNKKKTATPASTRKKTRREKPGMTAERNARGDLDRVQEQIHSTERRIRLTREQREQKEAELHQAEAEIGSLKASMSSVQDDVRSREQSLAALQARKQEHLQDRDRLVGLVRSDLQMAQRQGGQDYYKLLLNQQDPQQLARLMKYYGYLQQARADRVHKLNATLAELERIRLQEEEATQKLRSLRTELQQKQGRLRNAQQQRSQAIQVLNAQLESDDERLQKLRRDQQALQSVIERLAREAAARDAELRRQEALRQQKQPPATASSNRNNNQSDPAASSRPPNSLPPDFRPQAYKGRCPLPVAGGIRAAFGSARSGGLRWNGIVIAAAAGTPVHAIRPGRVAFADYLRGYGYLVIVDHGRGLMSLYGQNQSLKKKTGDDVAGNEVVAMVGDSGGSDADGLYFEIRMRGRPSDPANWCSYQ